MLSFSPNLLVKNCPPWFALESTSAKTLIGRACVPDTLWVKAGIGLRIEGYPEPHVFENPCGKILPARCPERHIQRDHSFCLGLRKLSINSDEISIQWWEQLRQYLLCQSTAERTGIWPPAHALDHGTAGIFHETALNAARELGIEEEYAAAYMGEPSWITDPNLKLFGKKGEPINGRSPCPMGCRHKKRRKWPIVRKDCKNRSTVLTLVTSEKERKIHLAKYWDEARADGEVCCGRMKVCGLK